MYNKLMVAPSTLILTSAGKDFSGSIQEQANGFLQDNYDWQDFDGNNLTESLLKELINHKSGAVQCVYTVSKALDQHTLLLPPIETFISITLVATEQSEVLQKSIQAWLDYFNAARQLLLIFPGQLVAKWPSSSVTPQLQQLRIVLQQDTLIAQAMQEWQTFIVEDATNIAPTALAHALLMQQHSLDQQTKCVEQKQQELSALQSNTQVLQSTVSKFEQAQQAANTEHQQQKAALESKVTELQKANAAKQKQLENAQANNKTLTEKLSVVSEQIASLNSALVTLESERDTAVASAQQSSDSLASCKQQLNETTKKLKQITAELKNTLEQQAESTTTELSAEKAEQELLTLQVNQLQEELELVFMKNQTDKQQLAEQQQKYKQLNNKLSNANQELHNMSELKSETELLQLQLTQLQEELEHYYVEYQKLKADVTTGAEQTKQHWVSAIKARVPAFLKAEKVQITGGFDKDKVNRLVTRLVDVTDLSNHWGAFSMILNDRHGQIEIEFHAPNAKRTYPLTTFITSGNNKVCDYSIIKPFAEDGCAVLNALSQHDKTLLTTIVNEIKVQVTTASVEVLPSASDINMSLWKDKLKALHHALTQVSNNPNTTEQDQKAPRGKVREPMELDKATELTPAAPNSAEQLTTPPEDSALQAPAVKLSEAAIPEASPQGVVQKAGELQFTKLTLLQNMVADTNQHLAIRASNLGFADKEFEHFDFKIGAKRIESEHFTLFGSIEFREQRGQAPINTWDIAEEDNWGKKLVLHMGPVLTPAEQSTLASIERQDQAFVSALLQGLVEHIHKLDVKDIVLANSLEQWHRMLVNMLAVYTQVVDN